MNLLIIGASSDIAMAAINALHNKYENIIATYRNKNNKFENLCKTHNNIVPIQVDLNNNDSIQQLISKIYAMNLIPTHILHCAAPICENQHFHKMDLMDISDALQIGLLSLCQITQPFLAEMSKKKNGKIIVILSDVINDVVPYCSQYIISKYAMLGYVKSMASEYGKRNVYINGISPGWTDTKYISNQPELLIEQKINSSKLKRLYKPEEVSHVIEYLLLDKSQAINGENILLDDFYGSVEL